MPRKARIVLENCPHHIVQRGHNRSIVSTEDRDYLYCLENLPEWKSRLGCRLYSYCLMTITYTSCCRSWRPSGKPGMADEARGPKADKAGQYSGAA